MLRALFGKTMSREEVERDVTETIESLARSSDRPPPPGWTLAGGLPTGETGETGEPASMSPSASPSPPVLEDDEGAPVGGPAAAAAARLATPPTSAARPPRERATSRKRKTKKVAAGTGG